MADTKTGSSSKIWKVVGEIAILATAVFVGLMAYNVTQTYVMPAIMPKATPTV